MKINKTKITGVIIIEPKVFGDKRGYFFESYNQKEFEDSIGKIKFVQDNESKSKKGVLRGLHYQNPPYDQAKLLRCVKGKVLDVVVDLRKSSSTFGKYISAELSEENKKQLFVPRGFAHGFIVLSDEAIITYKVDNIYAPKYENGILWNDKDLNIDWKISKDEILLSEKDKDLNHFKNIISPFD